MEIINAPKELPSNPYLDIPSPVQSQEFKKGYIMRKCCTEPNGKRTPLGKRGWRMYFAVLKDLVLYLYKDEATCKGEMPPKSSSSSRSSRKKVDKDPGPAALIRVHHALATNAPDYTKKQNVFRLFTADRAQFLIQTSDTKVNNGLRVQCCTDASVNASPRG
jgi:PH and SEC7 domain-containing protein